MKPIELKNLVSLRAVLVLQIACTAAVGTLLVSRAVVSSPAAIPIDETTGSAPVKGLSREASADLAPETGTLGSADITLVTHSHNRIINAFPAGQYQWHSSSDLPLANVLLAAATQARYKRSTYTSQMPVEDGKARTLSLSATTPMIEFRHVGFPEVETFKRRSVARYKRYRPTMHVRVQKDGSEHVVANIRCHGYSPHRTQKLANKYEAHISEYAAQYSVDRHLVKAVIAQESCFRNHAVSPVGAVGLMQLMPATARWLGVEQYTLAKHNLRAGVRYLSQLLKQFGNQELALAAYNAGPGNVRKYNGVPPFPETEDYIERVMTNYHSYTITESFKSGRM